MLLLSSVAALALHTTAQDRFANVRIEAEEVVPGIHVLYGAGGNIGLAHGDEMVFVIDDQFAPLTDKIAAKIEEITGETPDFVLNTHYHGDHTGGNENLGKMGALVFGHDNVRERVLSNNNAPENAPVVTFSETQTFHINGETVRAIHLSNAHTDGDAIVHFVNANVIHGGDLLFEKAMGSFPFIDLGGGGGINGAIDAVTAMIELSDENTRIIPGHGRLMDKAGLVEYRSMLTDVRDRVQAMINDGKDKDAIVKARPAKKYAKGRENGFIREDRFVGTVYDSLTAE